MYLGLQISLFLAGDVQTQNENAPKDATEPEKAYVDEEGKPMKSICRNRKRGHGQAKMMRRCVPSTIKSWKKDLEKMVTTDMTIGGRRTESGSNVQVGRRVNKQEVDIPEYQDYS